MEPDSKNGLGVSRRKFVAGSAAGFASVALAGCSGGEDGTTTTEEPTTEPEPEPENYVVTDDVIVGSGGVPSNMGFVSSCSPSRTFAPGMTPVFKIGVYDPDSGDVLGDDTIDSVVVDIDDHESVDLAWGGDAEEDPADEWSGSWTIPEDAEAGTISYTVEVSNGDANFQDVGIMESEITVIDYSQTFIIRDDVYTGSSGIPEDNAYVSSCQPERLFTPGMMVGFDVWVYDGTSGKPVGPEETDSEDIVPASDIDDAMSGVEAVTINIVEPDKTIDLAWSAEENDDEEIEEMLWNGTWTLPEDIETGTVEYEIDVEADGDIIDTPVEGGHVTNSFEIVSE
ncbi:MAG: hypothetical protein ACOCY6_02870 [Halodesulfurarchaeum sp.]